MSRRVLVTGAAGFIGFHLCRKLLERKDIVVGVDNLNPYYDVSLKQDRLAILKQEGNFSFHPASLENMEELEQVFSTGGFDIVVNMAAQAGVRYSLEKPMVYADSNLTGFINILENCRHHKTPHLVYASSSSVYGANRKMPFSESDNVDHPVSLYAATKKANELMAHSYSSLFGLPVTGLRIFTVYGPWGRPDMALFKFTKAILENKPVEIYNHGIMLRDFTYVEDIVEGVTKVMEKPPTPDDSWDGLSPQPDRSYAPYRIYNLGNNKPEKLLKMVEVLEASLGKKADRRMLPMQAGDVKETAANIDQINGEYGFEPKTTIEEGIPRFVEWYRNYYKV
ncbi:MAG: NAD-dependent epimerase [Nitrospinota bacterium]|nr:NAD-dependent epimerase [Nitrospinota bacterium]